MQSLDDVIMDPFDPNFDLVLCALSAGLVYVATYVAADCLEPVLRALEAEGHEVATYEMERPPGNAYCLTVRAPMHAAA